MTTEIPFTPATSICKTVCIDAPAAAVWQCITDPVLIRLWMQSPDLIIDSFWKEGSRIIFRGSLHGMEYVNKGVILQFIPERFFEYTLLSSLSGFEDVPDNYSIIHFELRTIDKQTTLILAQRNFITEVNYLHFNFYWNTTLELIRKLAEGKQ